MSTLLKTFAYVTGVILFSIVSLEVLLRVWDSNNSERPEYATNEGYYTRIPNTTITNKNEAEATISYTTDQFGLRNPTHSLKQADILLLGDSFLMADNTENGKTLTDSLRQQGYKVYNAGVNGFGTCHELFLLNSILSVHTPKTVVLFFYLGNDFRDNYFCNSPSPLKTEAAQTQNAPKLSKTKQVLGKLINSSALLDYLYVHLYYGQIKGMKDKPIASYCLAEIESLRNSPSSDFLEASSKTESLLLSMKHTLDQAGVAFVLVLIPSKAQLIKSFYEISGFTQDERAHGAAASAISSGYSFSNPASRIKSIATHNGIETLDLSKTFKEQADTDLYYYLDHHWNSNGQSVAADAISIYLSNAKSILKNETSQ